jgi:anhydro-N-acetylmuramic acid kinase
VRGFDVCACNQILDEAARVGLRRPFDEGGAAALTGTARTPGVEALASALRAQASEGRSLGTGDEAARWCTEWADRLIGVDLVAGACEAVGRVIVQTLEQRLGPEGEVFLAGGGVRNAALVGAIERGLGRPPRVTDNLGIPAQFREAACMGVLGALAADGVSVTLPNVTGARDPIPLSGAWVNTRPNPAP